VRNNAFCSVSTLFAAGAGSESDNCGNPWAELTIAGHLHIGAMRRLVKELEGNPEVMQEFVLSLGTNARRSSAIKATAAEQSVLSSAEGRAAAPAQLAAALSEADIDGDGIVTRFEFRKWMLKQAEATAGGVAAAVGPPTGRQLGLFGLNVAIPMIGFGFMDNFIMILAGDAIDASIGARLGISMMASAALVRPFPVPSGFS
jgi:hypothetical protein